MTEDDAESELGDIEVKAEGIDELENYCLDCELDCELSGKEDVTWGETEEKPPDECPYRKTIDESFQRLMKGSMETLKQIREHYKNIENIIPDFNIPSTPKSILNVKPLEAIRDEHEWERHYEQLESLERELGILEGILDEQQSSSKKSTAILIIALISLLVGVLSIVLSYLGLI